MRKRYESLACHSLGIQRAIILTTCVALDMRKRGGFTSCRVTIPGTLSHSGSIQQTLRQQSLIRTSVSTLPIKPDYKVMWLAYRTLIVAYNDSHVEHVHMDPTQSRNDD